jgi:uncharacterized protein (DUF2384 family)
MRERTGALASKISAAINGLGLTNEEVGDIVDASARSVARWVAGEVAPRRLNKERLLELAYVAEAVTEVLPADHASIWIVSPNRLIGHRKPADLIRDGQFKDVLDLIDAMADGVIV